MHLRSIPGRAYCVEILEMGYITFVQDIYSQA